MNLKRTDLIKLEIDWMSSRSFVTKEWLTFLPSQKFHICNF